MSKNSKFRVFKDDTGKFRWTFIARNGEKIAVPGEGYGEHDECVAAVDRVKQYAPDADVVDQTTPSPNGHDSDAWFELYEDEEDDSRWRLQAPNSEIIAVSSEGYENRGDARSGINLVKNQASRAEIDDETVDDDSEGGFVPPAGPSNPKGERFA